MDIKNSLTFFFFCVDTLPAALGMSGRSGEGRTAFVVDFYTSDAVERALHGVSRVDGWIDGLMDE